MKKNKNSNGNSNNSVSTTPVVHTVGKSWTVVERPSTYEMAKSAEKALIKSGYKRLDDLKGYKDGKSVKIRMMSSGFQVMTRN